MDVANHLANQRTAPRLPAPGTVWLSCRRGAAGSPELANGLLDLSAGGLQFLSRAPLTVGEALDVVLGGVGLAEPLRRRAEVRWLVELGGGACCAGVRFVEALPAAMVPALIESPTLTTDTEQFLFDPCDEPTA